MASLTLALICSAALAAGPTGICGSNTPPSCSVRSANSMRRAEVRPEPAKQRITLRWMHAVDGDLQVNRRHESVSYWPSQVAAIGRNRIAVAGKRANGNTVIELWTLEFPPLERRGFDPRTGVARYAPYHGNVLDKRVLYDRTVAGRQAVNALFENQGNASQLFVLFASDLCALELTSGALSIVASSKLGSAALVVPMLATHWKDRWSGEHSDHGYVYILTAQDGMRSGEQLVFVDGNKDGRIDVWTAADQATWEALELGNAAKYSRVR